MIILGVVLMFIGGFIFMLGKQGSCLAMIIGAAINFGGIACICCAL